MSLAAIHNRLWITILLFSSAMTIWGLWRFFRKGTVDSNYFGAVVIAEILYILQGMLGIFMLISGTGVLQRPQVHILYGAVIVLTLPGVYVYSRGDESRRTMLVYALAFVFLIAISIRSMMTGG